MTVFVLRNFFPSPGIAVSRGDVIELVDDKAEYFIEIGNVRYARKEDEERFLSSNRAVNFSNGQINMGIQKIV